MFIVHGAWLRKYMRWILLGLLIVLIPGFIALFTPSASDDRDHGRLPTLLGKPVNPREYQAARTSVMVQHLLRTGEPVPSGARFEGAIAQDAILQMLALREAQSLGLQVSDDEVRQQTERQSLFRNEQGQFDYYRYTALLGRLRIEPRAYEETIRRQILLSRLRDYVCAGAQVTPHELQKDYTVWNERVRIEYVTVAAADIQPAITVSNAEARALYDLNPETFRIPKQVKVRYAFVPLDTNSVTVTDQDVAAFYERNQAGFTNTLAAATAEIRAELISRRARRQAGDRATELTLKLVADPGQAPLALAPVAAAAGFQVMETDFFGPEDTPAGVTAGPELNLAAFALTPASPVSDPVEGAGGFYILELIATKPSAIPPFEQVLPQVTEQARRRRALEAAVTRGQELRQKAADLVAAGQSFSNACAQLQLTVQSVAPFAISEEQPDLPAANAVKERCLSLRVGDVSEFFPTTDGGMFFQLAERLSPAATAIDRDQMQQRLLHAQQEMLWQNWLNGLWRDQQVDLGIPVPAADEPTPDES